MVLEASRPVVDSKADLPPVAANRLLCRSKAAQPLTTRKLGRPRGGTDGGGISKRGWRSEAGGGSEPVGAGGGKDEVWAPILGGCLGGGMVERRWGGTLGAGMG